MYLNPKVKRRKNELSSWVLNEVVTKLPFWVNCAIQNTNERKISITCTKRESRVINLLLEHLMILYCCTLQCDTI